MQVLAVSSHIDSTGITHTTTYDCCGMYTSCSELAGRVRLVKPSKEFAGIDGFARSANDERGLDTPTEYQALSCPQNILIIDSPPFPEHTS